MTKKDQNDLIIPFSYFLDDFIEYAGVHPSLIKSLEEKHPEMVSELADVKPNSCISNLKLPQNRYKPLYFY